MAIENAVNIVANLWPPAVPAPLPADEPPPLNVPDVDPNARVDLGPPDQLPYLDVFFSNFLTTCNDLIALGDILERHTNHPADFARAATNVIEFCASRITGNTDTISASIQWYIRAADNLLLANFMQAYADAARKTVSTFTVELSRLEIVKALLESVKDYAMHWTQRNGQHIGVDAGVSGDVHGAGAGVSGGKSVAADVAHSSSLHALCVPAIEIVDRAIKYFTRLEMPNASDALELWMRGFITDAQAERLSNYAGVDWQAWQLIEKVRTERASQEELIEYARRKGLPDGWVTASLRARGVTDPEQQAIFKELYNEIPTIGDHLHWLQRNVFDIDYVHDFGLLDGFDTPEAVTAIEQQIRQETGAEPGRPNFWKTFGHDLEILGMAKKNAAYHYAAHWILPAPQQLAVMLQRLRPDKFDANVAFTEAQYLRSLAEQDVAPQFRERFKQIAYNALGIRQISILSQYGLANEDRIKDAFLDQGFRPEDAALLAQAYILQGRIQAATRTHGWTPQEVLKLYVDYAISADQLRAYLSPMQLTAPQLTDLIARGDQERAAAITKKTIEIDHKRYVSGAFSADDVYRSMGARGVSLGDINSLLQLWDLERQEHAHPVSVVDAVKWYKDGVIDAADLFQRLLKLGYDAGDATAFLQDVTHGLDEARKKDAAKAAADQQKKSAALQRAQAAIQAKTAKQREHVALLRQREITAEEAANFHLELYDLEGKISKAIEALASANDRRKANASLKWAEKYDQTVQDEIKQLTMLRAEGAPNVPPATVIPSTPERTEAVGVSEGVAPPQPPAAPPPRPPGPHQSGTGGSSGGG